MTDSHYKLTQTPNSVIFLRMTRRINSLYADEGQLGLDVLFEGALI